MACEQKNILADVAAAVLLARPLDPHVGYCRNCGKACCNCAMCQKEKPLNVCTSCHRAAAAVSKKAGA
jgi:hypothetical protein